MTTDTTSGASELREIPLSKLVPSGANVRRTACDTGIEELATSIAAHGLLQSLCVRPVTDGDGQDSGTCLDVSILTTALNELTRSVVTGFGLLGDDARAILRWAMTLSYSLALIFWLWDGRPAMRGPFLRMLPKFAAIGWLLEWFPQGSARLMQAAADTGVRVIPVEGFSLADPGQIAWLGIRAITPLMIRVKQMLGPIDFFLNFLEIVLFLLAMLITVVSFCILAIQVFLAFLEFRLLSLAAYLAIPFAVLKPTSFVAERAIGYIAASALKLLVLGAIVAVCGATLLTLTFQGDPTLAQAFGAAVLAAAIFVLAIKAPRVPRPGWSTAAR